MDDREYVSADDIWKHRTALLKERAVLAEHEVETLRAEIDALRAALVLRTPDGIACRICGKLSREGKVHAKWCKVAPHLAQQEEEEGD